MASKRSSGRLIGALLIVGEVVLLGAGLSACGMPDSPTSGVQSAPAAERPEHAGLPSGWTGPEAGTAWFDLAPTWSKGMEAIVAPDDPHRGLRLRVGCTGPQQPISLGLTHLPKPAKRAKVRLETLGQEFTYQVRVTGQEVALFDEPYPIISSMRMPGVKSVAVSGGPITYGMSFDLRGFEDVVQRAEVQACAW